MLDKDTQLCISVSGKPSNFGCTVHNAAFRACGLNFAYKAFGIQDIESAMNGVRALGIRGCGVSMPFKESVLHYLDDVNSMARAIGAVNTVVNDDGRLVGYNTDSEGAMRAIGEAYDIKGKAVVLLGAGGAARAIAFGLQSVGVASTTIVNRAPEGGKELAQRLGALFVPWERIGTIEGDLLVNATPVGMAPSIEDVVVGTEVLSRFETVLDVVVSPLDTNMISKASELGLVTVPGYRMSLYQAARQFELYTGRDAPLDAMENSLRDYLSGQ